MLPRSFAMLTWSVCTPLVGASIAAADVSYFTDPSAFSNHNLGRGSALQHTETFEEAVLTGGKTPFPDPLSSGLPSGPIFPEGLAVPGLTIQTNRHPGPFAPLDQPSGNAQALFAVGPGAVGTDSVKVGEDLGILFGIECSIDILFASSFVHAVGLDLSRFQSFGTAGWNIGIFDSDDVLIGSYLYDGPVAAEPGKNFFGFASDSPIARINLFDLSATPAPDAVDNIEIWVPAPSAAALMAFPLAATLFRRRRAHSRLAP